MTAEQALLTMTPIFLVILAWLVGNIWTVHLDHIWEVLDED